MAAYPGRVEIRSDRDSAHFLVEPLDETVTIAQLQAEFGFESTLRTTNATGMPIANHLRRTNAHAAACRARQPGTVRQVA